MQGMETRMSNVRGSGCLKCQELHVVCRDGNENTKCAFKDVGYSIIHPAPALAKSTLSIEGSSQTFRLQ